MNRLPFSRSFPQFAAIAALVAILLPLATRAGAQSPPPGVTILHSFGDGSVANDGLKPFASLFLNSDGNFYGTTDTGGEDAGIVFKMTPSGQETILHVFDDGSVPNDGDEPFAGLIQGPDGSLYGTTEGGGTTPFGGTVFKITPSGQYNILYSFNDAKSGNIGDDLQSALLLASDGNFYGLALEGGPTINNSSPGDGSVFRMTPSGVVTTLHLFEDGTVPNDGIFPRGNLIQGSDGNFYGMTQAGGITDGGLTDEGTAFKITPSGQVTILHSFGDGTVPNDGNAPWAGLIQGSDGNFYGTTELGGSTLQNGPLVGFGTVFKMTPSGQETILHAFGTVPNDGKQPVAPVIEGPDGNFYGVAEEGGAGNGGIVFKLTPSGQETILHSFADGTVPNDGTFPEAGLIFGPDGDLYGTTESGGTADFGTVFRLIVMPTGLAAVPGIAQVSLSWAAGLNATSYNLYRATSSGAETLYKSGITSANFTDTSSAIGTTYYYEVTAVTSGGESGPSNEASATPEPPIPPAPTNLVATAGNTQVSLSWTGSAGAASYNIYKSTTSGNEVLYRFNIKGTTFLDNSVTNGATYYYEVTAVNTTGESGKSNQASATPQIPIAPAPTNLIASAGNSQVSLSWSTSAGAATYNMYKGTASAGETLFKSGLTTTSYTDMSVTNGTTYFYEVTAVNTAGESGKSNQASATPFASVTFPAGLQMFSVPYSYPDVSLDTLFGYANVTLAVWSQPLAQYAITPTPPANAIAAGQGYWARFPHQVTTTVGGTPAPTNQPFEIALTGGWNMIGDPFLSSVPIANLTFNGGTETFAQATTGDSPLIGGIVYGYSQATSDYFSTSSLVPQQGYWVFAFANTDMEVPAP